MYFSGLRMMLVTRNNKILNLKIFCWLSILCQNQQNFKIMVKMTPQFYIKWPLSSISYLSMVKKINGFLIRKNSIFQNNKVKSFKNLEILQSKKDFFQFSSSDNFWHIRASKVKFSTYALYWEYYRKIKNHTVIGLFKSPKSYHKIGKNENSSTLEPFLLISLCNDFW